MYNSVSLILATAFAVAQAVSPPYSSHISNVTSSLPPRSSSSHSSVPSSSSHGSVSSSKTSYSSIPTKSSSSSEPPVYTTFTTTTLCPITYTHYTGSSVTRSTSYTTSIITVTSCKSGCTKTSTGPQPPPPTTTLVPPPSKPEGPVTVVTTITSFVKCSTPVIEHGTTKYYSTWLTPTYIPSTYITTYTSPPSKPTPFCPPAVTVTETKYATVTIYGNGNGGHHGGNGGYNGGNGGQNGGNNGGNGGNGGNNGGGGGDTKTNKPTHSPTSSVKPSGTGTHPSGTGNAKPPAVSASNPIYYKPTLSAKAW